MNVAITTWENRVSPVLDSAETLVIVEIRGGEIVARKTRMFHAGIARLVQLLCDHEVRVLICGALCLGPAALIEAHGIEVISFMAGDAEIILDRFARGEDLAEFFMPGCRRRRCFHSGGRTDGRRDRPENAN